jgi:hypothetical protein
MSGISSNFGIGGTGAFGVGALLSAGLNAPEALIFGSQDPLILGSVVFTAFEIPERINFGGTQKMTVHTLPGGERVIDVMGREEDAPTWSGIFLGNGAMDRAKQIDVIRAAGNVQQLSWGTLSYSVVVKSFQPDYKFAYHIPYKIVCEVLRDNATPIPDNSVTPEQAVPNDVSTASSAVPPDAPQNASASIKAETLPTPPSPVAEESFQPVVPGSGQAGPTVAQAAGNNLPTSTTHLIDLGPESSLANATPGSLTAQGIGVSPAMAQAQTAADIDAANAPLFTGQ